MKWHSASVTSVLQPQSNARFIRATGVHATYRTSASEHDAELAGHLHGSSRYADDEGARHASTFKVGMMLDEQLNQEMHNAMRSHQSSDDDKYNSVAGNKVSTSAAVLDLAHISQTSPRPLFATRDSPELPTSRRGSPPSFLNATTRSVPATPLGIPNSAVHILKSTGTPHTRETQGLNGSLASVGESAVNAGDLQASLSRLPSGQYDGGSVTFNSIQTGGLDDTLQVGQPPVLVPFPKNPTQYVVAVIRRWDGFVWWLRRRQLDGNQRFYHHDGSSYGLGLPARTNSGAGDGKMNGLRGLKHTWTVNNRFAGTCVLAEESSAEHRDLFFRETFGHFADLMTDPFRNYLCQKLLEYSADEQRSVICDSVAQDLVNIPAPLKR
ncbi:hypothetical protein C8R45DRAFT_1155422 [Mycena sanguinolenta]|nr:hypothetical protein C8R45DRAFT_1155422 [Mycena sanguinolenta]